MICRETQRPLLVRLDSIAIVTLIEEFPSQGPQGPTLDGVRTSLDRWYGSHPDQLQRPVIETIWFELAQPALAKAN